MTAQFYVPVIVNDLLCVFVVMLIINDAAPLFSPSVNHLPNIETHHDEDFLSSHQKVVMVLCLYRFHNFVNISPVWVFFFYKIL